MVDDWEVAREHITKDEEPLGKGSFGLVFRGVYSHPVKVSLTRRLVSWRTDVMFLTCRVKYRAPSRPSMRSPATGRGLSSCTRPA